MSSIRSAAELATGNLAEALEDAKEALNIAPNYPEVILLFVTFAKVYMKSICCT